MAAIDVLVDAELFALARQSRKPKLFGAPKARRQDVSVWSFGWGLLWQAGSVTTPGAAKT